MSNYHAATDLRDHLEAPSLPAQLTAIAASTLAAIASLRTAIERRLAMQRIARMSDHMLADFGFERDWDGTIRSYRDADTP